jgi:hypothetical protein
MKITKEWLESKDACQAGIKWFESQDETDAGLVMIKLVEENLFSHSRWLLSKIRQTKKQSVLIAIFSAELVLDIFESKYPADKRPRQAIESAKEYIKNPSIKNKEEASAAYADYASAYAAASAAAYASSYAAAYASAYAAASAAYASAYAAASAAYASSYAAAYAAYADYASASAASAMAYAAYAANDKKEIQLKIMRYAIDVLKL